MKFNNKDLLKCIENAQYNKDVSIKLNRNFEEDFFNIYEENEKDNLRILIQGSYLNSYMYLYNFAEMLENNEIDISFNENATDKHKNYFDILSEDKL